VKLTIVGCSPAWPNPGGAQSGYLVEGGGRLLLDCGLGVLSSLRQREPWPLVDAIALTHFHLDHWGDIPSWVFGASFGPGRDATPPQLWVPPGFAHGFCVLSEIADFAYKCTDFYAPEHERSILWNDPDLGIAWPIQNPTLSPKDAAAPLLRDLEDELPFLYAGS